MFLEILNSFSEYLQRWESSMRQGVGRITKGAQVRGKFNKEASQTCEYFVAGSSTTEDTEEHRGHKPQRTQRGTEGHRGHKPQRAQRGTEDTNHRGHRGAQRGAEDTNHRGHKPLRTQTSTEDAEETEETEKLKRRFETDGFC
jgi:hypothetical protein